MKIKVADLEPNPFRKIKEYPIDREKVKALKTSIKEKTFWDNILVRPHPTQKGKYQLAYGHHRHICLVELDIKEIDVPCRDLNDALMLQIMAEENLAWSTSPAIMTQTILTAKEFLDAELSKYETWEDFRNGGIATTLFQNAGSFSRTKKDGVGRKTLVKFLGGNWTGNKIRNVLSIINDEGLDQKAVCNIPTLEQANRFRLAVKEYETPKSVQKEIAKTIVKDGVGRRDIPELVAKFSPPIPNLKKKKTRQVKNIPNIIKYVFKCENDTDNLNHRIKALLPEISEIAEKGRLLGRLAPALKRLEETISLFSIGYERIQNGKKKETKKVASVQVLD